MLNNDVLPLDGLYSEGNVIGHKQERKKQKKLLKKDDEKKSNFDDELKSVIKSDKNRNGKIIDIEV